MRAFECYSYVTSGFLGAPLNSGHTGAARRCPARIPLVRQAAARNIELIVKDYPTDPGKIVTGT
jgi:hypothetical protein